MLELLDYVQRLATVNIFNEYKPKRVCYVVGDKTKVDTSLLGILEHPLFTLHQLGNDTDALFDVEINSKYYKVISNGLFLKSRKKVTGKSFPLATFGDFVILTSDHNNAAIFARNVTTTPTT